MSCPKSFSSEELLALFKSRGMQVKEEDVEKIKHINYYKLKSFAFPLAKVIKSGSSIDISYDGVNFQEVLKRYYQDKNLRIYLLHAIEKIEISIKTALARTMGLKYGAFGYLNFGIWVHRTKFEKSVIEKRQESIKKSILNSMRKQSSLDFANGRNKEKDGLPTIWLAIDILTFGEIVIILEMMNEKILRQIAKEYNISSEEFLSWIKCLRFVRNICAHNSNLIDINLITKPKHKPEWASYLHAITDKTGANRTPTARLAIIICIVVYLVKAINSRYRFKKIQNSIETLCMLSNDRAKQLGFESLVKAKRIIDII